MIKYEKRRKLEIVEYRKDNNVYDFYSGISDNKHYSWRFVNGHSNTEILENSLDTILRRVRKHYCYINCDWEKTFIDYVRRIYVKC